jgi:predicted dehydrogenase
MSARPLRVGIAGAGIGLRYARSFQAVDGVEVAALCAATTRTAGPAAEELGIPAVHTDYAEMLDSHELDIAVVATPNDLHHAQTLSALERGLHVVCDKPLALDAGQAREMRDAAVAAGRRQLVPFWLRFVPSVRRARELLAGGTLGEPFFCDLRWHNLGFGDPFGPMRWQFSRTRAGSGAIANLGPHVVDLVELLAGPLVEVAAGAALSVRERDGGVPDVEDTVAATGRLANGALVSFLASSVAWTHRTQLQASVHCAGGGLELSLSTRWDGTLEERLTLMCRGETSPQPVDLGVADGAKAQDQAYVDLVDELVRAIREDRPAVPSFDEGLRAQLVLDALVAAAAERRWVEIPAGVTPSAAPGS